MADAFGFLNALKPPGPTSTSYGSWVRRHFSGAPVGHWGTLDPAASGVLVLAVGDASRLLPYLGDARKRYVFEVRVGAATDTGDATGRVIARSTVDAGWARGLAGALASLCGELAQVPPMFSAVKIGGRPLYKAARAGRTVAREPRTISIYSLAVLGVTGMSARIDVECSAGTYVRTLCEQIGERLGVPAHLGVLLRTQAGPFGLSSAHVPGMIAADPYACLIDPLDVVPLARVSVDEAGASAFSHGNPVAVGQSASAAGSEVLVVHGGHLIGVGRIGDKLSPVKVFRRPQPTA